MRPGFNLWVGKIPWRRKWQPTPSPGESHGQKNLVGYSSWGHKELDTTECLTLSLFKTCLYIIHTSPLSNVCASIFSPSLPSLVSLFSFLIFILFTICCMRDLLSSLQQLTLTCGTWDLKFPDQGLNPGPLHWEHRPQGKSLSFHFLKCVRSSFFNTQKNSFMPLTECHYGMFCKRKHILHTLSSQASFSCRNTFHTQPAGACFSISFLSVAKLCLCMNFFCMDIPQGIYPPLVDRHLGCFQFGAVMNLYTINFCIHFYVYFFFG